MRCFLHAWHSRGNPKIVEVDPDHDVAAVHHASRTDSSADVPPGGGKYGTPHCQTGLRTSIGASARLQGRVPRWSPTVWQFKDDARHRCFSCTGGRNRSHYRLGMDDRAPDWRCCYGGRPFLQLPQATAGSASEQQSHRNSIRCPSPCSHFWHVGQWLICQRQTLLWQWACSSSAKSSLRAYSTLSSCATGPTEKSASNQALHSRQSSRERCNHR